MTTIRLAHSTGGYYLEIDASQIEEDLSKQVPGYARPFPKAKWAAPSATQPRKEALDLLNITRTFTLTGTIQKESKCNSGWTSTGTSAPEARDVLINMMRYGGVGRFYYGTSAEATAGSYSISNDDMYYTAGGFPCHFLKYKIVEVARDDQNVPIEYEVTITLEIEFDQGQVSYP